MNIENNENQSEFFLDDKEFEKQCVKIGEKQL